MPPSAKRVESEGTEMKYGPYGLRGLRTHEAAEVAGWTPRDFRSWAARKRKAGIDLQLPRDAWPDGRTPIYDERLLRCELSRVRKRARPE
jgi:hypothetical protein